MNFQPAFINRAYVLQRFSQGYWILVRDKSGISQRFLCWNLCGHPDFINNGLLLHEEIILHRQKTVIYVKTILFQAIICCLLILVDLKTMQYLQYLNFHRHKKACVINYVIPMRD